MAGVGRGVAGLMVAAALAAPIVAGAAADSAAGPRPVRLGVIRLSEPSAAKRQVERAVEALARSFAGAGIPFEAQVISTREIGRRASAQEIDLFVASGGLYRSLLPAGARDIATLFDPRSSSPNTGIGSNFFVRADSPIRTLGDLRGKTVAASFPNAFTGNWYAMGELAARGIDPETFFAKRIYRFPVSRIVDAVLSGEADAGVIVVCMLEEMRLLGDGRADRIRLLEWKADASHACLHMSDLYPSWTFATTPRASPETSALATATLLGLPPQAGWKWSVATDFSKTDALLRNLRIGPYEVLRDWSLVRFAKEYSGAIALAALAALMLLSHSLVVGVLVRRRTAQLSEALAREKRMAEEAAEANARMAAMQRAGTVGQMGSMLAHEIKQPLAAIRYMARGLLRTLEGESLDPAKLAEGAKSIRDEAGRAAEIVERVRQYARGGQPRRAPVDVAAVCRLAIDNFRKGRRGDVPVTLEAVEGLSVRADPLELELAVLNLVKNGAEACGKAAGPRVSVTVSRDGEYAAVAVRDNGPEIGEEAFSRLARPLESGKPDGLGLGLMIVRSVAEAAGGHLSFARMPGGGLVATMALRRVADGKEPEDGRV